MAAARSVLGMNGSVDGTSTATGRRKSNVGADLARSASGSVSFASSATIAPWGVDLENARTCDSTIGSWSTCTIRHAGSTDWAMSRPACTPGRPVPTSRNCLTPASSARKCTGAPVEIKDSGHDRLDGGRGRDHDPRRPAVGLKVVPAAIEEIRDPCRAGRLGIDTRGVRPRGRARLPFVDHPVPPGLLALGGTAVTSTATGRQRIPPGRLTPTHRPRARTPDVASPLTSP